MSFQLELFPLDLYAVQSLDTLPSSKESTPMDIVFQADLPFHRNSNPYVLQLKGRASETVELSALGPIVNKVFADWIRSPRSQSYIAGETQAVDLGLLAEVNDEEDLPLVAFIENGIHVDRFSISPKDTFNQLLIRTVNAGEPHLYCIQAELCYSSWLAKEMFLFQEIVAGESHLYTAQKDQAHTAWIVDFNKSSEPVEKEGMFYLSSYEGGFSLDFWTLESCVCYSYGKDCFMHQESARQMLLSQLVANLTKLGKIKL